MEQMVKGNWRIVIEAPKNEEEPPRFAVLRDERRVAWGLRNHEAALRWLRRLSVPVQEPLFARSAEPGQPGLRGDLVFDVRNVE